MIRFLRCIQNSKFDYMTYYTTNSEVDNDLAFPINNFLAFFHVHNDPLYTEHFEVRTDSVHEKRVGLFNCSFLRKMYFLQDYLDNTFTPCSYLMLLSFLSTVHQ